MNKSESKYFNTAIKMDRAFLEILEKKEFAYITVKEICEKAGVNRSTFYLHYETLADLLTESVEYMNGQFLEHMEQNSENFTSKLRDCPLEELYLVTPEYLTPYLEYIKEHQGLFWVTTENAGVLQLEKSYEEMVEHIFEPILSRYQVPVENRKYMVTFFIHGIMAIIREWLRGECADSIEQVISVIQICVNSHQEVNY